MSSTLSASGLALSSALQPTVPVYPTTLDIATSILALMGAQSGILSDYNEGSLIRTLAESLGSPVELQGVAEQTLAYQSMVYGAMAAFGIIPLAATAATGTVTFTSPGPATQAVSIPQGTLLQTNGGVQFQTVASVVLASGASTTTAGVQAVSGGTAGNVVASGIIQILSGLGYPLYVVNPLPTAGGANAESLAGTLARFAAAVAAPGLASPVAVANGAIGISYGAESVKYSNCLEPWITNPSAGAGFTLYLDDGTGSASSGLVAAVESAISGNPGFRPAGVPYIVSGATPIYATVAVTGAMLPQYDAASGTTSTAISGALVSYVGGLVFNQDLYQGTLSAVVGNAGEGQLGSFSLVLSYTSGATGVSYISGSVSGRVVLSNLTLNIS